MAQDSRAQGQTPLSLFASGSGHSKSLCTCSGHVFLPRDVEALECQLWAGTLIRCLRHSLHCQIVINQPQDRRVNQVNGHVHFVPVRDVYKLFPGCYSSSDDKFNSLTSALGRHTARHSLLPAASTHSPPAHGHYSSLHQSVRCTGYYLAAVSLRRPVSNAKIFLLGRHTPSQPQPQFR